ncbi:EAL domain-containing protein [Campylobacter sp. FMV-PI01]|uniref:EAL domain-containing protein n=1 Tax=Campylobacter portucalensis TaxID=2608384 RepID=A0A6L5WGU3_9BACT|nr:EAL domain-containing protein [Campylobacter portucalensis]MSN96249.1 EAL domain-containing protein [Campylobacter portucalensis]
MQLFSEKKEREQRFMLSLKIAFPFILVLIILAKIIFNNEIYSFQDTILFIILVACYVYYVIYLIYFCFKTTILDSVTNVFTREEIIKILNKEIKKNSNKNIVLINISNIQDINFRYSFKNGDIILKKIIDKLSIFFEEQNFKNLPIGRYSCGTFLFLIDCKISKLNHLLKIFERNLSNNGINNIEIKIDFATVNIKYDKKWENIINFLFYKILYKDEENIKNLKLDILDEIICNAIDNSKFDLKIQTIKSLKNDEDLLNLTINFSSKKIGNITKSKLLEVIHRNNYGIKYNLNMIKFISKNFDFENFNSRVFIEILPISLRNQEFKNEIYRMATNNLIDPNKIVFEFFETEIYDEINRFSEIIEQLKNYGFKIAINQFLGKNASFEYFKYINFDYVIYDLEINKNYNNKKIKKIFYMFNKNLKIFNIKTVIRFVDKIDFLNDLKNSDVDFVQGFCIDKPKIYKEENALRRENFK